MSLRKLKSVLGRAIYVSPGDILVAKGGLATGGDGKPGVVYGGSQTASFYDDFHGTAVSNAWSNVKGDTGNTGAGMVSSVNGVYRLALSATTPTAPSTSSTALSTNTVKSWKPNQKNLRFSARVKIPTLAGAQVFAGLSDSGGSDMPAWDTGGAVITNMADGIGFVYGATGDAGAGTWKLVSARSVAGDSGDPTAVNSGITPTANVYTELEIFMGGDSGEIAVGYVNGKAIGGITQPVDATVALAPWVGIAATDTGALSLDVDYVAVSGSRDTGT